MSVRDLDDFGMDELNHDLLQKFGKWTEVQRHSRERPQLVLQVILKCHDYSCARKWAAIHKVSQLTLQVVLKYT